MAIITVGEICTAVHDWLEDLEDSGDVNQVQNYNELTEGMNSPPVIQVYPENWETDVAGDTDRSTFTDGTTGVPGLRQTTVLIRVDLYARQRSQLNEDWRGAVALADLIDNRLNELDGCPLFDQAGIRAAHWTATRVVFEYATVTYTGFRFDLTLRIF